jgi:hypothetical protein
MPRLTLLDFSCNTSQCVPQSLILKQYGSGLLALDTFYLSFMAFVVVQPTSITTRPYLQI